MWEWKLCSVQRAFSKLKVLESWPVLVSQLCHGHDSKHCCRDCNLIADRHTCTGLVCLWQDLSWHSWLHSQASSESSFSTCPDQDSGSESSTDVTKSQSAFIPSTPRPQKRKDLDYQAMLWPKQTCVVFFGMVIPSILQYGNQMIWHEMIMIMILLHLVWAGSMILQGDQ